MIAHTSLDAARIGKIASRMESPHDGEALNAARMLIKYLGGHGLRISDVVERGISGGNSSYLLDPASCRRAASPPFAHHRTKIDALLSDPAFMAEYLTRRSLSRLQSLRFAPHLDGATMAWIDGLVQKARDLRAGRAA